MAKLKPPVSSQDHIEGNPRSPVVLVEYGDFQCPHCGAAYPIVKRIQKKFKSQLAFVFRHFPLTEAHPYAQIAAVAAEAAANQGQFWEMHDLIYENQESLSLETLVLLAQSLKLDMKIFQKDMKNPGLLEKVEADFESGVVSGVNGTPSFYINGLKFNGSYDYETLSEAIEYVISQHTVDKG